MGIKVLIVDDSAIVRQTFERQLAACPDIEVVGSAPDPFVARDKIVQLKPDVVTLDIEMPRMDGVTFLRKLMQHHPIPVIIVSSLAQEGSQTALDAVEAGAIDVIAKPGSAYSVGDMAVELIEKIRGAYAAKTRIGLLKPTVSQPRRPLQALSKTTNQVVVIGASTGGTRALEDYLLAYPPNAPATVIVQHMPAGFTKSFSERLNGMCQVEIKEAQNGDSVIPGRVLVAPGNYHTLLRRSGANYCVEIKDGPLVDRHRPSVNVLFNSAAQVAGANAIAVMLTGMGDDGATGMLKLKEAGATCIAQDEATCVVYGMPKCAVELGAVHHILPLPGIAPMVIKLAQR